MLEIACTIGEEIANEVEAPNPKIVEAPVEAVVEEIADEVEAIKSDFVEAPVEAARSSCCYTLGGTTLIRIPKMLMSSASEIGAGRPPVMASPWNQLNPRRCQSYLCVLRLPI
jgi:hypothetical protein